MLLRFANTRLKDQSLMFRSHLKIYKEDCICCKTTTFAAMGWNANAG